MRVMRCGDVEMRRSGCVNVEGLGGAEVPRCEDGDEATSKQCARMAKVADLRCVLATRPPAARALSGKRRGHCMVITSISMRAVG